MDEQLERLRQTLNGQGIASDAAGTDTLGRTTHARDDLPSGRTPSGFPRASLGSDVRADFQLQYEIGRGGMATVWAAQQTSLAREVAVKRCHTESGDAQRLLLREALITGQLEHPSIVPVHAVLVDERGPAVVMKRVSGTSWDRLIKAGETPIERHLDILMATLNAVEFAHSRGVIHRDIKPANVMIGDFGQVYLLDWGVARRADDDASDAIVGTPFYMAPEMAEGRADERTDIFLLGATLHEVLTGAPRHSGESALLLLYAAIYVEPFDYADDVPDELAALCNRACARRAEERFESVAALRTALVTFREHRDANLLCQAAERAEAALAAQPRDASYSAVQSSFLEARLSFQAALKVWPQSQRAATGLRRTITSMCDIELRAGRLESARALLATLDVPDLARTAEVEAFAQARRREHERIARIERDQDPRVGERTRTQSYLLLGAGTALMTLALSAQRLLFPRYSPSPLRLVIVAAVVLALLLLLVLRWRRSGDFNVINRRIAEITVSTLAVSFASRLSGLMIDAPVADILIHDAFVLGLGGALLSAYHRAGPWLAAMSFVTAVVGSIWPMWVDELFIALSIFVPTALLAWRRADLVPRALSDAGLAKRTASE